MLHLNTAAKQKQFVVQAIRRVRHHAPNVEEIAPIVIRAVFDHADRDTVYGHQYDGGLTGSGWAEFGGRRIWGGYNRDLKQIEFREESRLGRPIARFDNGSSKSEIERQIRGLKRRL
ncbi:MULTISPECIES: hypothetical protein [unclassified Bradyrhizobium]|uniref:hypothetical protein n=1 Tax=unclassified Bradyrhizobium TaxID=2631580 RepID=UPI0028EA0C2A|nr:MULTISPECIES: hypothetical protein [unclassified Bradyrhizobium]